MLQESYTGIYLFDLFIVSSLLPLITTFIQKVFNGIIAVINKMIPIILDFFEVLVLRFYIGIPSKYVIIDDYNPVFNTLVTHLFKERKEETKNLYCYNMIEKIKRLTVTANKETNSDSNKNASNITPIKDKYIGYTQPKKCQDEMCITCSKKSMHVSYQYNVYQGKLYKSNNNKTHYNTIEKKFITIKFGECYIMFEKHNCTENSKILLIRIFSKNSKINALNILQNYLESIKDYKNKMYYSCEIRDDLLDMNTLSQDKYRYNSVNPEAKNSRRDGYIDHIIFGLIEKTTWNKIIDKNILTHGVANLVQTNNVTTAPIIQENTLICDTITNHLAKVKKEEIYLHKYPFVNTKEDKLKLTLIKTLNIGPKDCCLVDQRAFNHKITPFKIKDSIVTSVMHEGDNNGYVRPSVSLIISKYGQAVTENNIKKVIKEIIKTYYDSLNMKFVAIYKLTDIARQYWSFVNTCDRTLQTMYLPHNQLEKIKNNIENFMGCEDMYKKLGISYKMGILLYGPPGTGKTSLVKALANYYGLSIYIMDINHKDINDNSIIKLLNSLPNQNKFKILLFEDIDTAFIDKEAVKYETKINATLSSQIIQIDNPDSNVPTTEKSFNNTNSVEHLTYSGLLNAFDGVAVNLDKTLIFMTTNYKQKLGDALIRPGRIDYSYCLDYCTEEQIRDMTKSIVSLWSTSISDDNNNLDQSITDLAKNIINMCIDLNNNSFKETKIGITTAKLQAYLMKYQNKLENVFNNYHELFVSDE